MAAQKSTPKKKRKIRKHPSTVIIQLDESEKKMLSQLREKLGVGTSSGVLRVIMMRYLDKCAQIQTLHNELDSLRDKLGNAADLIYLYREMHEQLMKGKFE